MGPELIPLYFEGSWSILSSIGIVTMLLGGLVIGITGFSPIALVPITCSIAGATANGLCYYVLYQKHAVYATMVGGIFADLFWLIEEAGFSFYSYLILLRILRDRARTIFITLFWTSMTCIVALRFAILACRAQSARQNNANLQGLIAHLHIGYFTLIAVVEIISSFFLIRIFHQAKKSSAEIASRGGLFRYLTQSTELRLATLMLIGISRAVTYSFQKTARASDVTGQLDRFVATLECCFPMVMYIDILASRIATSSYTQGTPSNVHAPRSHQNYHRSPSHADLDVKFFPASTHARSRCGAAAAAATSSSQERMITMADMDAGAKNGVTTSVSHFDSGGGGCGGGGATAAGVNSQSCCEEGTINKTVEFEFHVNAV